VDDFICRTRDEDERLVALRAAVSVGDEQLDRDDGVTYTPERFEQITQKALCNARND
jgi:antitoxin ParD1/3/4